MYKQKKPKGPKREPRTAEELAFLEELCLTGEIERCVPKQRAKCADYASLQLVQPKNIDNSNWQTPQQVIQPPQPILQPRIRLGTTINSSDIGDKDKDKDDDSPQIHPILVYPIDHNVHYNIPCIALSSNLAFCPLLRSTAQAVDKRPFDVGSVITAEMVKFSSSDNTYLITGYKPYVPELKAKIAITKGGITVSNIPLTSTAESTSSKSFKSDIFGDVIDRNNILRGANLERSDAMQGCFLINGPKVEGDSRSWTLHSVIPVGKLVYEYREQNDSNGGAN